MITLRAAGRRRVLAVVTAFAVGAGALVGCGNGNAEAVREAPSAAHAANVRAANRAAADTAANRAAAILPAPAIDLGKGLLSFPGETQAWVAAHPSDPRTSLIRSRISSQPSNLWLTGDESFGNLHQNVSLAQRTGRTMLLTFYNVPGRDDGLSAPSALSLTNYKIWINRVASTIGNTRAIVVLEPDSLWFYDRLPNDAARSTRLAALAYAVLRMQHFAPHSRVYLEAGTSSGSVSANRMATLLVHAGITQTAGFAVNVSSYSPTAAITKYAQGIRTALLRSKKLANPRYVVDTGRNGASSWDTTWCNPTSQRLGISPRLVRSTSGLDLDLWVKAPGTSDGNCGPVGSGAGTYGGQFLPDVAYKMITG